MEENIGDNDDIMASYKGISTASLCLALGKKHMRLWPFFVFDESLFLGNLSTDHGVGDIRVTISLALDENQISPLILEQKFHIIKVEETPLSTPVRTIAIRVKSDTIVSALQTLMHDAQIDMPNKPHNISLRIAVKDELAREWILATMEKDTCDSPSLLVAYIN